MTNIFLLAILRMANKTFHWESNLFCIYIKNKTNTIVKISSHFFVFLKSNITSYFFGHNIYTKYIIIKKKCSSNGSTILIFFFWDGIMWCCVLNLFKIRYKEWWCSFHFEVDNLVLLLSDDNFFSYIIKA